MNEQELQQAFIQFLAQKTGAKSQQELEAIIQQMGEEGLKQAYAEFMQVMQQQQVRAAKFGAKLNYIKQLRGQCPDGYEAKYLKEGGMMTKKCVACEQNAQEVQEPSNPIEAFKCGRKMRKTDKKACGGPVKKDKCGNKIEKAEVGTKVVGHKGLKGTETNSVDQGRKVSTREWEDGTQSQKVANPWGGFTYYGRDGRQYDSTVRQEKAGADSLQRVDWRTKTTPKLKPKVKK